MNLQEYFEYKPSSGEKNKRRLAFLKAHKNSTNPKVQGIVQEIQSRMDICDSRTIH